MPFRESRCSALPPLAPGVGDARRKGLSHATQPTPSVPCSSLPAPSGSAGTPFLTSLTIVEKCPNEPDVRNTHGTILVKLGQWEEGVKDLEFALPKLHIKGPTHASLALAYRNLGLSDAANEHERLAREPSAPAAPNPLP